MSTTFLALSSMSGIACASDADHTIYQLSKKQPLAIAVNSYSPIPWDDIINSYKEKGEPGVKDNFEDYALDFISYLSTIEVEDSWRNLSLDDGNIIFMGYGKEDLFPCTYDAVLSYNEETGQLELKDNHYGQISHSTAVSINLLGNLDSVSTLIWGATNETKDFILRKRIEQFNIYKERVLARAKGTKFEAFVTRKLEAFDPVEEFSYSIDSATDREFDDVMTGIDSFSIEEMVTAVETLVNAEVRLDHLRFGCKEPLHSTREIAVITRVEGLTWIKHSLYAL